MWWGWCASRWHTSCCTSAVAWKGTWLLDMVSFRDVSGSCVSPYIIKVAESHFSSLSSFPTTCRHIHILHYDEARVSGTS